MRILTLLITFMIFSAFSAAAADILLFQSHHSTFLDQEARLIQNSCAPGCRTLVKSDYSELDLGRIVNEERPRIVIAVGESALKDARKIRQTPVLYTMVLNPKEDSLAPNIAGVSMMVSPESYMKLFRAMGIRKVGVIHNPRNTGPYLRRAKEAAARSGIEIIALAVTTPKEVYPQLTTFDRQKIGALWIVPDSTAITGETVDAYFRYGQEKQLPVVAFSESYLAKGAIAAIEVSQPEITRRLCASINLIKAGKPIQELGVVDAGTGRLVLNINVAQKLGIDIKSFENLSTTLPE